mmetsp:Transcript_24879/g.51712  ORF Transcript_24879/g.51712 Transcript_24879/m.51712 type:complete len:90 (+) Transcript_24879:565-834(+)
MCKKEEALEVALPDLVIFNVGRAVSVRPCFSYVPNRVILLQASWDGISPEKLLKEKSRSLTLERFPIVEEMGPLKLDWLSSMLVRVTRV